MLRNRVLILLLTLLGVALAASGGQHLRFTNNYRVFFSDDNPQLLAFEALENTYAKSDSLLFVLAPEDGDAFSDDTLRAVELLTERAWKTPYSTRVDSITNFQHTEADGDDLIVRNLVSDAATLDADARQAVRDIALNEPLLKGRLVSLDARVLGVNVTVHLPGVDETREVPEIVAFARDLADELKAAHPQMSVYLTGMVMMNHAFTESSQGDMKTLVPVSFAMMALMLWLLTRGFTGTVMTMGVVVLAILFAMGLGGWVGFPITPPSAIAPTVILTVAIANCVHVLVTLRQRLSAGDSREAAIVESLRVNLQPVFLASLTTAFGFLSMNFSDVPPFQHLGTIVSFGVASSFVMAVTFLPAAMSLLPVRGGHNGSARDRMMDAVASFVITYRRVLLWGMLAIVALLVASIPRNELNDVFLHYFDDSVEFRRDSDFTVDNLTGIYRMEYSLHAADEGGVSAPEFLRDVEAFAEWFRNQPEVRHVNVISDVFKRLNRNLHGDDPTYHRLPESRELSAQYLLLYEMSLPYGLDLNNQINIDRSSTRMTITTETLSSNAVLGLDRRAEAWATASAPSISKVEGSGSTIMFANIGRRNIRAMLVGTSVALVCISLAMILALGSLKVGLLSLVPNLVPGAMGFGIWGLAVGEVGLSLSVVTSMTLGIVVDDTVHFLSKYQRARNELGYDSAASVRYAFVTVGRALVVTSLVLVVGFLVLSLSSFQLNSGMGLLTALVIALALAADFLLLPPLLMTIEGPTHEQSESAGGDRAASDSVRA